MKKSKKVLNSNKERKIKIIIKVKIERNSHFHSLEIALLHWQIPQ